ncbi:MAG: regulatory protein RecX [Anaerolineae bacterium]|jgi:regulatory protein
MEGTVTRLERQKRRRNRVSVFLDEEYAFSLEELTAATLRLGQYLSEDEIRELRRRDDVNRAQERALRLLEVRPRSRFELEQRLRKAGFEADAIEEALGRLERVELVDDDAFAQFWVEQRLNFRPRSRRALRYELRRQGVSEEAAEEALEGVDDTEAALALVEKHLSRRDPSRGRESLREELFALLRRNGFGYGTTKEVLDSLDLRSGEHDVLDHSIEDE